MSQLSGPGASEFRLSWARRWVFPALRGDRDWDLEMRDAEPVLRVLPSCLQPRF